MKGTIHVLGYDFGASSGRAMLGELTNGKLTLTEVHRFSNDPVILNGRFVWDVPRLFFEMKQALVKVAKMGVKLDGIGVDTWGVDFGLLDKNGNLVALPVHYRDHMTDGMMEKAFEIVPKKEIFAKTGLAFLQFNTLYQLLALKDDPALQIAEKLAFMPDLLMYLLTGELGTEYTIASTSQLVDPVARDWSWDIIRAFGLPERLFTPIQPAGSVRGTLLPEIAEETGVKQVPVIAVGTHDTASAVAAVPAQEARFAYISSGTWSLLGAEGSTPLCEKGVMDANYTNEGGVCGKTRLLQNIMGLWIIQECKREWDRKGEVVDFGELVKMAEQAPAFRSIIDVALFAHRRYAGPHPGLLPGDQPAGSADEGRIQPPDLREPCAEVPPVRGAAGAGFARPQGGCVAYRGRGQQKCHAQPVHGQRAAHPGDRRAFRGYGDWQLADAGHGLGRV